MKMDSDQENALNELIAIKKLLVLALVNSGMTQNQIAAALGVDRTGVGRLFPKGTLASFKSKG
jgi:DNA-binding transcriptional regulator LsrR (DeoR family)